MESFYKDGNCYYLQTNIGDLNIYEKSKEIIKFVDSGTKLLEMYLEVVLRDILYKLGANTTTLSKSVLKRVFKDLKSKGIEIEINELFTKDENFYGCEFVATSKNNINVVLEDNKILCCGKEIIVKKGGEIWQE